MSEIIKDFLFADDCALNAGSEDDMQESVDKFSTACSNFGLTISIKKTEVLYQPAPGQIVSEPNITVHSNRLNKDSRTLAAHFLRMPLIDNEVDLRIARASASFGRLSKQV